LGSGYVNDEAVRHHTVAARTTPNTVAPPSARRTGPSAVTRKLVRHLSHVYELGGSDPSDSPHAGHSMRVAAGLSVIDCPEQRTASNVNDHGVYHKGKGENVNGVFLGYRDALLCHGDVLGEAVTETSSPERQAKVTFRSPLQPVIGSTHNKRVCEQGDHR